jgi:bacteriocin-like protein
MKKNLALIDFKPLNKEQLSKVKGGGTAIKNLVCDVAGCPSNECPAPSCRCELNHGVEVCNPVS